MLNASRPVRAVLFVLLIAAAAWGQKTTGEIRGTVEDPANAVVPKASVSAKDTSTGIA